MPLRTLLACLLLTASLGVQAATEVLQLQHRSSAELLPTAQSFLGKDGSVSTFEDKLIITASQPRIDELRALLGQLDTAPRRLLISVDSDDRNFQDSRGNARIIRQGTSNRSGGLQQVQASEGQAALIQVGRSVPVTTTRSDGYGGVVAEVEYRNVTQGFYVTPSLSGDSVRLAISTNNDRMSPERDDVVNVQSTDTTITGRLGEWMTLAAANQRSQADRQPTSLHYGTERGENMTVRVKVDVLE